MIYNKGALTVTRLFVFYGYTIVFFFTVTRLLFFYGYAGFFSQRGFLFQVFVYYSFIYSSFTLHLLWLACATVYWGANHAMVERTFFTRNLLYFLELTKFWVSLWFYTFFAKHNMIVRISGVDLQHCSAFRFYFIYLFFVLFFRGSRIFVGLSAVLRYQWFSLLHDFVCIKRTKHKPSVQVYISG